jgi:glycosyltransferase involved in cell wall biosynthesis
MKITLIGQANESGIGTHYSNIVSNLLAMTGINRMVQLVDFTDHAALMKAAASSHDTDINISFVGTDFTSAFKGTNINWGVFESTRIPDSLLKTYQKYELWLPSAWGYATAITNGIDANKMRIVQEGVDPYTFHPYNKPTPKDFRFLLIGKYESRKSIDETIDAFAAEFSDAENVHLIIKSDFFKDGDIKHQQLSDKISATGSKNIHLYWGHADLESIAQLYRSSSVFVFPTKAEGWGLPIIEAAACGLPIITTEYSAHTEFLSDITSSTLFVDYKIQPIDCEDYCKFYPAADGDYGSWAVPEIDSIRHCMRQAYTNHEALSKKALVNSDKIRSKWSWFNSAQKVLKTLENRGLL